MPIGGRNPRPGVGRPGTPATLAHLEAFAAPDTIGDPGAGGCGGCSGGDVQYRFEQLTSTLQFVNGTSVPVATLAAPPQGSAYVLERIVVNMAPVGSTTPTTGPVLLQTGDLDANRVVDFVPAGAELLASSADAQPIRLPAAAPLHFVWTAGGSTERFTATVQVRVESAD